MRRRAALAAAATVVVAAACVPAEVPTKRPAPPRFSFAVIGDLPYGPQQLFQLSNRVEQLSRAPNVQLVVHLGDITSGGADGDCTDSYASSIKSVLDRFAGPLVYTPGDNEWTDCLGAGTGAADPLGRLSALRDIFFATPGRTLGRAPLSVATQPGYPEDISFDRGGISIAAVHLVGSDNGLAPWPGHSTVTTAQRSEEKARVNADIRMMRSTFARAKRLGSRAVVLLTQADMFSGWSSRYRSAFQPVVQALASESLAFDRPVLLINGDTHLYRWDMPLTTPTWKRFYGVSTSVPNLVRVVVTGGTSEWLRVTVEPNTFVLQWERVPFT
jgi:hypothetical protein